MKRTLIWAGALIAFDAFFLNQGGLSALVGLWTLVVTLPRAAFTKDSQQKRLRFARGAIMLGAVLLVFAANSANDHLARSRAESLVAAIKTFHQQNQRFPTKLDELVPDFVDHVPVANYILFPSASGFHYMASPERHILMYTDMPPFGRSSYQFEEAKWKHMD